MAAEIHQPRSTRSTSQAGLLLAAAAAAPFAAGAALYEPSGAQLGGPQLVCPFLAVTGLPCPLCGSTRAIVLAGHGDAAFLDYNAVTVLVLVAAIVLGLVAAVTPRGREPLARLWAAPGRALLVIAVVAWAWTLTHQAAITA